MSLTEAYAALRMLRAYSVESVRLVGSSVARGVRGATLRLPGIAERAGSPLGFSFSGGERSF